MMVNVQTGSESTLYPSTLTDVEVDACLGHVNDDGLLGYVGVPPCVANIDEVETIDGVPMCADHAECNLNITQYVIDAYEGNKQNKVQPIGVARDGHVIMGPYDSKKRRWCN